jgi:large subunit ribosomal protein L6
MPITVPPGVSVEVTGAAVIAKGALGDLSVGLTGSITASVAADVISVTRGDDTKESKSLHGLYQRLIANMVTGVSSGFTKVLLINGVGYRAELQGAELTLHLGFSDPVRYAVPDQVKVEVPEPTRVIVSGADRQVVGQVAADIRGFRPPEPYKGKGIRYEGEHVRRKAGKSAASAA